MTLMAQVEQARNRHQESNQQLLAASGAVKGIFAANRVLSPTNARDVLKLAKPDSRAANRFQKLKRGISKADLEARLKATGWTKTTLIDTKELKKGKSKAVPGKPSVSTIWKNPTGDESIRLTPKGNSIGLRGYDGPWGGGLSKFKPPGGWKDGSPDERALDIKGNTAPKGSKKLYPDKSPETHFEVRSGSRVSGTVKALENVPIQRAAKAMGPFGLALDAYSLKEAWDADGGQWGENTTSAVGGVAGGWAGAATGAAIGSAAGPVGTVIGGVIGGVIGSGVGSEIADEVGDVAEGIGEGIGDLFDW